MNVITLKVVLRANAASCIIFALIFLLKPTEVATFLGGDAAAQEVVLLILGAILLVNGLHLLWASVQSLPSKLLILYFSIGDFIWVFASISLVIQDLWITTAPGVTVSLFVATMIGAFGGLQMTKRKEMNYC
jgi:hypothetical protein